MTAERLKECLKALNWTRRGLAVLLDVDEKRVRRWLAGKSKVPETMARWIETLATFHEHQPAPTHTPFAAREKSCSVQ